MLICQFVITFALMKHILIVDDERDLCEILRFNIAAEGFTADVAYSAEEALQRLGHGRYDLILLDVMMEGMSGFELARQLNGVVPVIFITAKDSEEDVLEGFSLGADDYVVKPFSVREVIARVKAVLLRSAARDVINFNGLEVDEGGKTARVDGEVISLTKTEYELLRLFLTHQGQVFSRQELLSKVWPNDVIVTDRTVDVNITRLRKKLGSYAANIVTRQGYGYCFQP